MRRSTSFVAAALPALLLSILCCREEPSRPLARVRIGYQALASSWAFYVANERLNGSRSFFEQVGLEVEPVKFDSSNSAMAAILAGKIATDSATTMTVLANIEERAPGTLKCFGFQIHTPAHFLESFIARRESSIRGYADLKGKKVGVFPGTLNTEITKLLVRPFMDSEHDVTILQMAPTVQVQALARGDVDALISYEPTTTLAVTKGIARVVEDSPWAKHLFNPFPVAAYCFSTQYLKTNPREARAIAQAWARGMRFTQDNPAVAARVIPKYTGISLDIARLLNQPLQQDSTEVDRKSINQLMSLYLKFGLISKPVDGNKIYYQDVNFRAEQ